MSTKIRASIVILILMLSFVLPVFSQTGFYTLNGGTAIQTEQTYTATETDQSSVYVLNSGNLTLNQCTMTKTGDASDVNAASQYGINAGVYATTSGDITINGGSITTNASGANGLFATGTGSTIIMTGGVIDANGGNAHGVDVTYGGSITLNNVIVTSSGASSSTVATDFGGGTVTVNGGSVTSEATTDGSHSAGIYSTGVITVNDATVASYGDCGGVIDGANSIILSNTSLSSLLQGFKVWKTTPASGAATITITGGSVTSTNGDIFYVTGETGNAATANITLNNGTTVSSGSGKLINVTSSSTATLTINNCSLTGNLIADATSTLNIVLCDASSISGVINRGGIRMDSDCQWNVTGNSFVKTIVDSACISSSTLTCTNITGNGYTVYYDSTASANAYLRALTYTLVGGGILTPGTASDIEETKLNIPVDFVLNQNYPNPFNPNTNISFEIIKPSNVILRVFSLNGKEVAILAKGYYDVGKHEISFDASGLADGIYYYTLNTNGTSYTKKMILIK